MSWPVIVGIFCGSFVGCLIGQWIGRKLCPRRHILPEPPKETTT